MNLDKAARIIKLDGGNCKFYIKNSFLALDFKEEDGSVKEYSRVMLYRDFPFEMEWEYISVFDLEGAEIGIIYDINIFQDNTREMIKCELERKYYTPIIKTINSLKERHGFSYWKITTKDDRELTFSMQDTFKNMVFQGDDKLFLIDVDGNRFVIESILGLDKNSYRKIELYI